MFVAHPLLRNLVHLKFYLVNFAAQKFPDLRYCRVLVYFACASMRSGYVMYASCLMLCTVLYKALLMKACIVVLLVWSGQYQCGNNNHIAGLFREGDFSQV